MAYDSARNVTVLFGGHDGSAGGSLGDTWAYDGGWTQVFPPTSPSARWLHALAYDSARNVTVLFGGYNYSGLLGDTWEWNGSTGTWTEVFPATSPAARNNYAMAYDSARSVTILFGGQRFGSLCDDTWKYPVCTPPAITDQPDAATVTEGDPVTFSVTASGTPPLSYEWYHDGNPVGSDQPTYEIAAAAPEDAGWYWVVISNACGSVESDHVELIVEPAYIPGDLNGDGCVGHADLGILLADWECTGGDCPGDCDGDGDTDHSDLGILLAHWGEGCP